MKDFAHSDRQAFIGATWHYSSLEAKRRRALEWLGAKWVLHKAHAVKRKDQNAKEQT